MLGRAAGDGRRRTEPRRLDLRRARRVRRGAAGRRSWSTADGTWSLANQQARATFGLSPTDVGRPFQDLELSYRPARAALATSSRRTTERRTVRGHRTSTLSRRRRRCASLDVQRQPLLDDGDRGARRHASSFTDVTDFQHAAGRARAVQPPSSRPPTRSSSRPTRSWRPPTRSCSRPSRSWRPPTRSSSPPTRSSRP